jgi:nucleotide-binding universal stress UspA family protein
MYQKIMVPLDGSDLAKCVLPHAEAIATGCEVKEVVFVRAVEPLHLPSASEWLPTPEERQRIESSHRSDAQDYLNQLVGRLKYDGVDIQSEVITGKAAESLADYAEKNGVDLIVIATHGRSGVSRWVWGSVADRILRSACVPVLMVRAPGCVPGI